MIRSRHATQHPSHSARPKRALTTALVAITAVAALGLPSVETAVAGPGQSGDEAQGSTSPSRAPSGQVPGIDTSVDTSHATRQVSHLLADYFTDKSRPSVDGTMSHFAPDSLAYGDATLGVLYDWPGLETVFTDAMPTWEANGAKSYPVRIVGDSTSAIVDFVDTPGTFGPGEIRPTGIVDFDADGRIVRWVDYWDGRHFGLDGLGALKAPADSFLTEFQDDLPGETASPAIIGTADALAAALRSGDAAAATALLSSDAVFEDSAAHISLTGPISIGEFLERALGQLPYAGPDAELQHVVGSDEGGGYEWTNTGAVRRGLTTLELDSSGRITRFTAVWDGSLVGEDELVDLARLAIES